MTDHTVRPSLDAELDAVLAEIGGAPNCLHCRIIAFVNREVRRMPERPAPTALLRCLAQVLGDHVGALAAEFRAAAIDWSLQCFAERVGAIYTPSAALGAPAVPEHEAAARPGGTALKLADPEPAPVPAPAPPRGKLH